MISVALRCLLGLVAMLGAAPAAQLAPPQQAAPAARFTTVDLYLDAGDLRCAAWQIEFAAETGDVRLVGVEGGDAPAWKGAPFYDPAALKGGRVIVAAFSTAAELPTGRVRVARLQLRVGAGKRPEFAARLQAASDPDGERISADVLFEQGE